MCNSDIFVWLGSLFGYVVQWLYNIFNNYGVAIIIFTVLTRLLMFPMTIKQQKTMAAQQRVQPKIDELRAKYGNDQQGLNLATQELYTKEGINPYSGCLPMFIQFPIFLGLYRAICMPISCVLHVARDLSAQAASVLGITDVAKNIYYEMDIIRAINKGEHIEEFMAIYGDKFELVEQVSQGFSFLGIDLLSIASLKPINGAIIFSVLVFIAQVGGMILTNKINGTKQASTPGCSPNMMNVGFGAMSVFISFSVPAALVLYWIASSALGPVQSLITKYFFGPLVMEAEAEAKRNAKIIADEKAVVEAINEKKGVLKLEPMEPKKKDYEPIENTNTKSKNTSKKNKKKKR